MELEFYYADTTGNVKNCDYPHKAKVTDINELTDYLKYDYVFVKYNKNYRDTDNFISSCYAVFDCDNDHTTNQDEWIQIEDIKTIFKDVECVVVTSRNHMLLKNGKKSPRPRFHIIFKINEITKAEDFCSFMKRVQKRYVFFDPAALDAGRFMFGCDTSKIYEFNGSLNLTEFMEKEEEQDKKFEEMCNSEYTIQEGARNSTMSHIAGKILIRFGENQESYSKFLEQAEKCDPPLDDAELETIWNSAKKFYKKVSSKATYIKPDDYCKTNWDEPLSFDEYVLKPFPVDALPKVFKDYAISLSKSTQTPVDMAACSILNIMAIACQGNYKIRGKDDWTEPLNLFTVIVAEPSERKSAVINATIKPLNNYESEVNREKGSLIETSKMRKRILEKKQRQIEDNAAKGKATDEDIINIANDLASFKEEKPLKLYVDDVTTEKLVSLLAESNGRASVVSSEGGIFDMLSGIYTKNVNIDVMLKGHSGDTIRVDRIGRNSETILNPTLSVLLTVQPSVLNGLMQSKIFRNRGLTARFLYCYPTSIVGTRKYRSEAINPSIYQNYEKRIINMLQDKDEEIITLSKEADELLEQFSNELEPQLADEYKDISDWVGKLIGETLRIAGVLGRGSIVRNHELLANNEKIVVDKETMKGAIEIGKYYLSHATSAFSLMGSNYIKRDCKYVIEMLKRTGLEEFTRRDVMRNCRSFKTKENVQEVLDVLLEYGYIAYKQMVVVKTGGRPVGQVYLVNPKIK